MRGYSPGVPWGRERFILPPSGAEMVSPRARARSWGCGLKVLQGGAALEARWADYNGYYVTSMRFREGEMPWEEEGEEDEEDEAGGDNEEAGDKRGGWRGREEREEKEHDNDDSVDISDEEESKESFKLEPASEAWLQSIGFSPNKHHNIDSPDTRKPYHGHTLPSSSTIARAKPRTAKLSATRCEANPYVYEYKI